MMETIANVDVMASLTCCCHITIKIFRRHRTSLRQETTKIFFATLVFLLTLEKSYSQNVHSPPNYLSSDGSSENSTPPPLSGCRSCAMQEDVRLRSLQQIKEDVLKKMGLKSAPNITGANLAALPAHVLDMIESGMQSDQPEFKPGAYLVDDEDEFHVKTEKFFSFSQPYPRLRHSWRGHDILYFSLADSSTKYQVGNATLFIYIKGAEKKPPPTMTIEVFKVFKNVSHLDPPGKYRQVRIQMDQPLGQGEWVKIPVTKMVSEWFKSAKDNYGFIVNATVNGSKVVVTDPKFGNGEKLPFLEIETADAKKRTRRNLGLNCDAKMNEPLCCRYPLTVDFEEFGWDFIIAPKKYEAHYCAGDCPFLTLQKHPHTHIIEMASANMVGPCCTSRKMSAISMLYFDQHFNIVFGNLPGMVVDRCGCS